METQQPYQSTTPVTTTTITENHFSSTIPSSFFEEMNAAPSCTTTDLQSKTISSPPTTTTCNQSAHMLPPPPPPMMMSLLDSVNKLPNWNPNTFVKPSSTTPFRIPEGTQRALSSMQSPFPIKKPFQSIQPSTATTTTTKKPNFIPPARPASVNGIVPPNQVSNPILTHNPSTQNNSGPTWAKLKIVGDSTDKDAPTEFQLIDTNITIGRGINSNVRIMTNSMSKFVSRSHADIVKVNDFTFLLSDLGSTNGTLVNGKRVGKNYDLKHGDLIIITGGIKSVIGDYFVLDNGKKRSDFKTEQEWKYALISSVKNAFMYKFEMVQTQNIAKNLSKPAAINFKNEEDSSFVEPKPSSTPVEMHQKQSTSSPNSTTATGKRGRQQEEEVHDNKTSEFESNSKKLKEMTEKFNKFKEACTNEFNCVICCNFMVEPKMLECGHSFCRKCLHDWLSKNKSCPVCRKSLSCPSYPNRALENIMKCYIETCATEEESQEHEERIKAIKVSDDESFAKFIGMVENARAKKIKFLDVTVRWKMEEKRTFKNGLKQYFGKDRDEFCKLVGITESFVKNCGNDQLLIACENLEIPHLYTIVGQEVKTMRRVIDFDSTRQSLISFFNAKDNLH